MRRIRVLIADDAVVVRRMLGDILSSDPALEVAGAAANGRIALARIPEVNPDVVILDVEMPEMDGLETLRALRRTYPFLPVVMFSVVTQRGAAATLDALSLGANDYVTKPANVGSAHQAIEQIRAELIPKIKMFCAKAAGLEFAAGTGPARPSTLGSKPRPTPLRPAGRVEIVAIGVSTGGPNALCELVPEFPADFSVPILIVQHMPPVFTKLLAERLEARANIKVEEGAPGQTVKAGHAFVAPGNYHMIVQREEGSVRIQTNQEPPENSCRPAVDVLFRSVAETYGTGALGVVMTGMGQDGLRGSERIREAGGQVIVQDERTSVVWGMPGLVANAGLADKVLPLQHLGSEIVRRVRAGTPCLRPQPRCGKPREQGMTMTASEFDYIRRLVLEQSAIVLEEDKQYLAESRLLPLARREGFDSIASMVAWLEAKKFDGLHRKVAEAMTTNETSFFRDFHPFEALRKSILPELMTRRACCKELNFWSAGCSSGQEPYSLAILLQEHFPSLADWSIRIIATELSTEMLARAREGRYSQLEVNRGLPASLLVKYFRKNGTDWQIREDLRRRVEFQVMNLAETWPLLPPMDVILMRNVLIYFGLDIKKKILGSVRQLLRADGFLFLGGAETTLNLDDAFERIQFDRTICYRVPKA